jgi:putative ABC transport system substrate-binding protein
MFKKIFQETVLRLVIILMTLTLAACGGGSEANDALPSEANEARTEKEDKRHFTMGLVTNNPNGLRNVQGFQDGMAELGYIEGENVTYIFKGEPTKGEELDAVLEGMVESEVDLIFTAGTPTGVAAHRITKETTIPVIFGVIADPIAAGVMEDLTRPGGNMTGVKLSQNQARRLELLLEIAPKSQRILVPYNPLDAAGSSAVAQVHELAPHLGVEIVEGQARNDEQVTELLKNMSQEIDAIFLVPDSTVNARLDDLLAIAFERHLPVSAPSTIQVEKGALTTYGFVHHEVGAQAARIADQVLRGADPAELPVETAEFFLVINLPTAEAIELEISDDILQQAEIIIRADETE